MTVKNFTATAVAAMLLIAACNTSNADNAVPAPKDTVAAPVKIIGKTGYINFPGGIKVEENFTSDSTLHWKFTDPAGKITEADERVTSKKINDSVYFINWIEKTGLTVSQILDINKKTATAFTSHFDEKSDRGQRSSLFLEGSLEVK